MEETTTRSRLINDTDFWNDQVWISKQLPLMCSEKVKWKLNVQTNKKIYIETKKVSEEMLEIEKKNRRNEESL